MDGSAIVGLASMVTLTEGGVLFGLVLLGWWLFKHIQTDKEDRGKMYTRIDFKIDELRKEMRADYDALDKKVDKLAEAVARLEGYHSAERDK